MGEKIQKYKNFDEAFSEALKLSPSEILKETIDPFVDEAFTAFQEMDDAVSASDNATFLDFDNLINNSAIEIYTASFNTTTTIYTIFSARDISAYLSDGKTEQCFDSAFSINTNADCSVNKEVAQWMLVA